MDWAKTVLQPCRLWLFQKRFIKVTTWHSFIVWIRKRCPLIAWQFSLQSIFVPKRSGATTQSAISPLCVNGGSRAQSAHGRCTALYMWISPYSTFHIMVVINVFSFKLTDLSLWWSEAVDIKDGIILVWWWPLQHIVHCIMSRTPNNSTHIWKVLTTQGRSIGWQAEKCVLDPDLTNDMLRQEDMVVLAALVGPCYEVQGSDVGRYY
jgi:hypothetical protein